MALSHDEWSVTSAVPTGAVDEEAEAPRLVPGTHGPAHHVGADLVAGIRIIARGGNGTTS